MTRHFLFRTTVLLLFFFLLISGLYFAKVFFIPVIVAVLLAIVLLPMNRKMEGIGMPRLAAIIVSLFCLIAVITAILFLFYTQIASFAEEIPIFKSKILEKFEQSRIFIETKTNIPATKQTEWIKKSYNDLANSSGKYISYALMGISQALATFGIIVVYILFFLLYRKRIRTFILKLAPKANHEKVIGIMNHTVALIQHYLIGLLIELVVLGTLNAIGLLVLGIRQAIFFGYLAGLLNIIPYIGTLAGSLFPMVMALIFKDSFSAVIAVGAVMGVNQFIDNNFLTPKIIGSHVRLNPLATIMVIIIGGLLWGVAGMILFIPLLGILKIICDNIEVLEPFGYLLGDDEKPSRNNNGNFFRRLFKREKGMASTNEM